LEIRVVTKKKNDTGKKKPIKVIGEKVHGK